jgi:hypothetical protein
MERRHLDFAKGPLLGLGLICVMVAPVFFGLGLDLPPNARLGPLGLLRVFGPDVLSLALLLIAALLVLTGLACLRRLVGGRPAVAIRADGIEFRSLCLSRYIPWKALDGSISAVSAGTAKGVFLFASSLAVRRAPASCTTFSPAALMACPKN